MWAVHAVACDTDKLPGINKLPPPRRLCTSPPCYLQKVSAGLAFYLFVVKCVSCPELMSLHTALLIHSAPPHEIYESTIPDWFVMRAATASLRRAFSIGSLFDGRQSAEMAILLLLLDTVALSSRKLVTELEVSIWIFSFFLYWLSLKTDFLYQSKKKLSFLVVILKNKNCLYYKHVHIFPPHRSQSSLSECIFSCHMLVRRC